MKKKTCIWVCVILTFIMFFSNMQTTYSASVSDLEQERNSLKNKLDQANKEIESLSSQMSGLEKQISQLNAQISIYQDEINALQSQINTNEVNLQQLQDAYDKRANVLANRIVAQYEAGDVQYLDMLLGSESLTDFVSTYYTICEMAEMDAQLLQGLENTKNEIEATKQQLVEDKKEVEEQSKILKSKKSELETSRNQLRQQKSNLEAEEKQFEKEIEAVQQKIDEAVRDASGYTGSFSGTLSWPISSSSYGYNLITYGYGPRDQPVAGASTNHKALDIGVSYKPIYSAADGYVVIAAGGYGGYGNFIMIKHSNNLYTCYGHLSSFNVHAGQTVSRGQQIAVSGNTGVSSGPHLHFEVRTSSSSSSKVNPLNYISGDVYSKLVFMF